MITLTMRSKGAVDRNTLLSINKLTTKGIRNIATSTTSPAPNQSSSVPTPSRPAPISPNRTAPAASVLPISSITPPTPKPIPPLFHTVQKGQKAPLSLDDACNAVKACFGWNTTNAQCDVDVSAFLLGADGKILGDDWFVFYGQPQSPDNSTLFQSTVSSDREAVCIDFQKLNPRVQKIVFVLTINEAFEKRLHFGMLKDAYIRILTPDGRKELVSYQMTEYYSNVISMMIGELYQYNGAWKFNAVGNGVAKDLAGLCALYGVQVCD